VIEKIFTETLVGKEYCYYCREVQILALCDDPFLLSIVGLTNAYPYAIVIPYDE